jgi:restriction endonuclease Mrr
MADPPCLNSCRYLIAEPDDDDRSGYPPVHGIDCRIEVLCWGGDDIDNVTLEATCSECVSRDEAYRRKLREAAEAEERPRVEAELERFRRAEIAELCDRDYWMQLSDLEFERACARLFAGLGYVSKTTQRSNDGAFDVILEKDGKRGGAQCKAWSKPCGVKVLREFYGALHTEKMTYGFFVARNGFTKSAYDLLKKMPELEGICVKGLLRLASRIAA